MHGNLQEMQQYIFRSCKRSFLSVAVSLNRLDRQLLHFRLLADLAHTSDTEREKVLSDSSTGHVGIDGHTLHLFGLDAVYTCFQRDLLISQ